MLLEPTAKSSEMAVMQGQIQCVFRTGRDGMLVATDARPARKITRSRSVLEADGFSAHKAASMADRSSFNLFSDMIPSIFA